MPGHESIECEWCGANFPRPSHRGPKPRFCSAAHRQYSHRDLLRRDRDRGRFASAQRVVDQHARLVATNLMGPFIQQVRESNAAIAAAVTSPVMEIINQHNSAAAAAISAPVLEMVRKNEAAAAALAGAAIRDRAAKETATILAKSSMMESINKNALEQALGLESVLKPFRAQQASISAALHQPVLDRLRLQTQITSQVWRQSEAHESLLKALAAPALAAVEDVRRSINAHLIEQARLSLLSLDLPASMTRGLFETATDLLPDAPPDISDLDAADVELWDARVVALVFLLLLLVAAGPMVADTARQVGPEVRAGVESAWALGSQAEKVYVEGPFAALFAERPVLASFLSALLLGMAGPLVRRKPGRGPGSHDEGAR